MKLLGRSRLTVFFSLEVFVLCGVRILKIMWPVPSCEWTEGSYLASPLFDFEFGTDAAIYSFVCFAVQPTLKDKMIEQSIISKWISSLVKVCYLPHYKFYSKIPKKETNACSRQPFIRGILLSKDILNQKFRVGIVSILFWYLSLRPYFRWALC